MSEMQVFVTAFIVAPLGVMLWGGAWFFAQLLLEDYLDGKKRI